MRKISSTISYNESLLSRGYILDAVLLFCENYYRDWEYLFAKKGVPPFAVDPPPLQFLTHLLIEHYDSLIKDVTSSRANAAPIISTNVIQNAYRSSHLHSNVPLTRTGGPLFNTDRRAALSITIINPRGSRLRTKWPFPAYCVKNDIGDEIAWVKWELPSRYIRCYGCLCRMRIFL